MAFNSMKIHMMICRQSRRIRSSMLACTLGLLPLILVTACESPGALDQIINEQELRDRGLLALTADGLTLGILPDAGGRAVYLSLDGGPNLLHADPSLWEKSVPQPGVDAPWAPYNGHIVWVAPQSHWWTQQDVDATRRRNKAPWPPDPYLTYGRYKVTAQTQAALTLKGPVSPVTGLQLTKRYAIRDGCVELTVTGVNRRSEPVAWGLWSNTRFRVDATTFVPVAAAHHIRYDSVAEPEAIDNVCTIRDGWFSMQPPGRVRSNAGRMTLKAFINPMKPIIIAATDRYLFFKRQMSDMDGRPHPEHTPIEIYYDQSNSAPLLELEMQAPYGQLEPGEAATWSESWKVVKAPSAMPTDAERMAAVQTLFSGRSRPDRR